VTAVARPLWFGPAERPRFGWVHHPADATVTGAVVLCPPLGRELNGAHSTYRLLAQRIAAGGRLALRFDYDGAGDSAGEESEPGRLEAWLGSIDDAVGLAHRLTGMPVALVGMRMGALLATAAAARNPLVEWLALWDGCSSGRAFVKEQRMLQLTMFGTVLVRGVPTETPEGMLELPGWQIRTDTAEDLQALRARQLVCPGVRAVLVVAKDAAAGTEAGTFPAADIEHQEAVGQEDLLQIEMLDQVVPTGSLEAVAAWLERRVTCEPSEVVVPHQDDAVIATADGEVLERHLVLGDLGLFGIATVPARRAADARGQARPPWAVFLTTGNDSHVGPNRIWVDMARRWAGRGVPCVRVDLSGHGDSPTRPGQRDHVVRAPESFDDVRAVAEALSPDDPSQVILVGLCSGGYQALDSAVGWTGGRRPVAVYAVNPLLRFAPPEMARRPVDRRRRVCRPPHPLSRSSRRLDTGPLRRGLWWGWWLLTHPKPLGRHRGWLQALLDDGVDVRCICGAWEARPFEDEIKRARPSTRAAVRDRIEVMPELDHGVIPWAQRQYVADVLTDHVVERFATVAQPASEELSWTGG